MVSQVVSAGTHHCQPLFPKIAMQNRMRVSCGYQRTMSQASDSDISNTGGESVGTAPELPRHVAVVGAAGGLGQGVLQVCRAEGIGFTAIVRSRPERISDVPAGSRVAVVSSLADKVALTAAFEGASAVLTVLGLTATSSDRSALLSANMDAVAESMLAAGVERILVINTLIASAPGQQASMAMRFFSLVPGKMGRGAREQQAVIDAIGTGGFSSLRWTLVRAGLSPRGADEPPVASPSWDGALNSYSPVSYQAMGRWMLEEAAANQFVRAAPLVSRRRK